MAGKIINEFGSIGTYTTTLNNGVNFFFRGAMKFAYLFSEHIFESIIIIPKYALLIYGNFF